MIQYLIVLLRLIEKSESASGQFHFYLLTKVMRRLAASGSRCTCFSKRKNVATNVPAVESVCLSSADVALCNPELGWIWENFSYRGQASPFTFSYVCRISCIFNANWLANLQSLPSTSGTWGSHHHNITHSFLRHPPPQGPSSHCLILP